MEDRFEWQGYEWITRERWGQIHPAKTVNWYDPSQVIVEDGILKLGCQFNPKEFEIDDPECDYDCPPPKIKVTSPFGIGLVSCTQKFGYGRFEIEAKLPHGQPNAWPAFWMWSWDSWPPEIDVFEAYTNAKGSYFNWNIDALWGRFWRAATNVHLGKSPNNYNTGAKRHWMGWKDPSKRWVKYAVEWYENKIEIYYNGRSIRKITDQEILSQFHDTTMNVIINNGIQQEYSDMTSQYFLQVRNFKYTPID
jgi:beta-glucanase (GH16 family)